MIRPSAASGRHGPWSEGNGTACFIVKKPPNEWCFFRSATTLLAPDHPAAGPNAHVFDSLRHCLALAIAAIFGLQLHQEAVRDVHLVVLMVFASPVIAAVYGGLTLIVCNLISSWLGWPELSLPWWPQRPGRAAVTISWVSSPGGWVSSSELSHWEGITRDADTLPARCSSKKVPWRYVKNFRQAFEGSKRGIAAAAFQMAEI